MQQNSCKIQLKCGQIMNGFFVQLSHSMRGFIEDSFEPRRRNLNFIFKFITKKRIQIFLYFDTN